MQNTFSHTHVIQKSTSLFQLWLRKNNSGLQNKTGNFGATKFGSKLARGFSVYSSILSRLPQKFTDFNMAADQKASLISFLEAGIKRMRRCFASGLLPACH